MGIPHQMHVTGKDAWERIQQLAQEAEADGKPISEKIALVLTDLEMPEMDGFTLTRKIKTDERLKKIPVVIHSSLSAAPTKIIYVKCRPTATWPSLRLTNSLRSFRKCWSAQQQTAGDH